MVTAGSHFTPYLDKDVTAIHYLELKVRFFRSTELLDRSSRQDHLSATVCIANQIETVPGAHEVVLASLKRKSPNGELKGNVGSYSLSAGLGQSQACGKQNCE